MSKQRQNKNVEDCPVCGGKIWGRGIKVVIEGAKLSVCNSCAQHGKKVPNKSKKYVKQTMYQRPRSKSSKPTRSQPRNPISSTEMEIVPDFAKKIKNKRNILKLNQDQFAQKLNEKPSLLRRIETGKVKPTIKLARKIEKVYKLKLVQSSDDVVVDIKQYVKKRGGSSLGDIAFIKKKE